MPLIIKTVTKGIARLKVNSIETVAMANSRYASDPTTIKALVGNIEHFEMGLDRYYGSPDGDNVELQMQMEFRDNTLFKTANYVGIFVCSYWPMVYKH